MLHWNRNPEFVFKLMSSKNKIGKFLFQIRGKITLNEYENIIDKMNNYQAIDSYEDNNIIAELMNDVFELATKFTDSEFKYLIESVSQLRPPDDTDTDDDY